MTNSKIITMDQQKILIIFDLDDTLIRSSRKLLHREEDFRAGDYLVYKRPFLDAMLINLSRHFYLAIWSSGTEFYVNSIVEQMTPARIQYAFVWSRAKCTPHLDTERNEYYSQKRLKKVCGLGFSMEKILIIEDTPGNVVTNYGNAIIVKPFIGKDDDELLLLNNYLETLKDEENVRKIDKRGWKLR